MSLFQNSDCLSVKSELKVEKVSVLKEKNLFQLVLMLVNINNSSIHAALM